MLLLIVTLAGLVPALHAQDSVLMQKKFIYFPYPMQRKWNVSVGLTTTTMPKEITEEFRYRVPALDINVVRRLGRRTSLHARVNAQLLQNLVMLGAQWAKPVNSKYSFGAGVDGGFWFGFVNTAGIKTRGTGWQLYPHMSFGYRFNKPILLTVRAEGLINFGVSTFAGETQVASQYPFLSGSAFTVLLEQPFYGRKSLTLGFRAAYTNFFWQTWTLFEGYNRNIFFPQAIIGLIL